jgi:hypothetical protein
MPHAHSMYPCATIWSLETEAPMHLSMHPHVRPMRPQDVCPHALNLMLRPHAPQVEKINPAEENYAKWTRCHLSGELLATPVCVDELGSLFNKDAV